MKTKLNRNTASHHHNHPNQQQKRPSLTKLFTFDEKSSLEISNYLAPKYEDAIADATPSYEVSVILPQKSSVEKYQKPTFTMQTADLQPASRNSHRYQQVLSTETAATAESFIVNLPPEFGGDDKLPSNHQHSKQHQQPEIAAAELTSYESRVALKVKASSVGNLCDIHR